MASRYIIQRRIVILVDENGNEEILSQNEYHSHHELNCGKEEFGRIVAGLRGKDMVVPKTLK